MPFNCVVLIKQVPDTKHISGNVMKEDGTLNRAALPVITNPEDLNALEMGLSLRDKFGGKVTVLSMGPPRAADALRDALARGADEAILISDRRIAGSDTLATAYVLSAAVKTTGRFDLILCGRQAIDGDTAQVGPQVAERLGIPQISYTETIEAVDERSVTIRRTTEYGYEIIWSPLPVLLTVLGSANDPRYPSAKRLMKYKKAMTPEEVTALSKTDTSLIPKKIEELKGRNLLIPIWGADEINVDLTYVGLRGSPTRVDKIHSVVLKSSQFRRIDVNPESIQQMLQELKEEHILG